MTQPILAKPSCRFASAAFAALLLASCANVPAPDSPATPAPVAQAPAPAAAPAPAPAPAAAPAAPAAPPPAMPYERAVLSAANALFGRADLGTSATVRGNTTPFPLVIDPLVDGNSGYQSEATRQMQRQVVELLKANYPNFTVQPFTTNTLARGPLLFIGTFTAVDKERRNVGEHDAFRICLALVDLRTGKIVSKGLAFAEKAGVDTTPTPFHQEAPAWLPDPATLGYIRTCQGTRAGDPINPAYWDRIMQAALINDATIAYEEKNFDAAYDLFRAVLLQPGGEQLRVFNGLYLSAAKLGRKNEAAQAFGRIVDYGLANKQLGVMFTFRPGSTLFSADPKVAGEYPMWLQQIAQRVAARPGCVEVVGHTSKTGPEPMNQRISLMRAQFVEQRIDTLNRALAPRTRAVGKGSAETRIGIGTDDMRDLLDRRVELKVVDCPA